MSSVAPFRRRMAGQQDLPTGRAGRMTVVAMASLEPGAGRTMLAAHIAVQAGVTGDGPAAILDADPKGALFHWWDRRRGKMAAPAFGAHCSTNTIAHALESAADKGTNFCVVDTAAEDPAVQALAELADMVVIPTDARPTDIEQAMALGKILSKIATVAFVINCRAHSGLEEGNALAGMCASRGWPAGVVQHAGAFSVAMTAGRAVTESHAGSYPANEIAELWTNLRAILLAG